VNALKCSKASIALVKRHKNAQAYMEHVRARVAVKEASDAERLETQALQAEIEGRTADAAELRRQAAPARHAAPGSDDDLVGDALRPEEPGVVSGALRGAAGWHAWEKALAEAQTQEAGDTERSRQRFAALNALPRDRGFYLAARADFERVGARG